VLFQNIFCVADDVTVTIMNDVVPKFTSIHVNCSLPVCMYMYMCICCTDLEIIGSEVCYLPHKDSELFWGTCLRVVQQFSHVNKERLQSMRSSSSSSTAAENDDFHKEDASFLDICTLLRLLQNVSDNDMLDISDQGM